MSTESRDLTFLIDELNCILRDYDLELGLVVVYDRQTKNHEVVYVASECMIKLVSAMEKVTK